VLTSARREAARVPALTARAAAFAEVAERAERALGAKAAAPVWQSAMETAAAVEDGFARAMAARGVAARRLRRGPPADDTKAYIASWSRSAAALPAAVERCYALRAFAELDASWDKAAAAQLVAQAAEAARAIPEHLVRASALAATALAADAAALGQTAALAAEAEKSWRLAAPGAERDFEGAEVARAWAAADWQQAAAFATGLTDSQAQAHALQAAAEELAGRDLDKALAAVQRCAAPDLRAAALAAVAARMATSRADLAATLAREALAATKAAAPPIRDAAAAAAAVALAASAPDEALATAAAISSEDDRAQATVDVAAALAPANAARALEVLSRLDRPELAEPAMPDILYRLASTDPDAAVKAAQGVLERYLRVLALVRVWDAMTETEKGKS
jgi:hypothetical protein